MRCCVVIALAIVLLGLVGSRQSAAATPTELHLWIAEQDRGLEAALRVFESRHAPLRVLTSMYVEGNDAQKLMTAIAGGEPPDVVQQDRFSVGEWAARDALLRLNDRIDQSSTSPNSPPIDPAAFYPACWAESVYENSVYAIPYSSDARALFYNEDLLRRAGFVDHAGNVVPPRNWDELRHYAKALTQHDAEGRLTVLGFAPNYGNSWLYLYGWLNGGEFMSRDGRRVTLDDPQIVEALQYMGKLYDAVGGILAVDAFVNSTTGPENDPFATGRVAMKIDGNWNLNFLSQYHPHLRFGVAPPPAPAGRQGVTWSGGFAYAIPATCRHPDLAFKLIRFLVSDEGWQIQQDVNVRYAASRGLSYIPRMTAQPAVNERATALYVRDNPRVPARVRAAVPLFDKLMHVSRFRPVSPIGQLLWDEHVRAIEQSIRGNQPAARVLTSATKRVQVAFDRTLDQSNAGEPVSQRTIVLAVAVVTLVSVAILFVASRQRSEGIGRRDETLAAAFFVSPWLIGFLALTLGPVVASLVYSFCRYDVLHGPQWIGLANFRRLLTDDPLFWKSLANTAYMLIGVPLGMALGLAIALLLNAEVRGVKVYRTCFYLPSIMPLVASSILWLWLLNPTSGLVNGILRLVGIEDVPLWLASPSWALGSKASLLLMDLWGAGGSMVIWLAGLKSIPRHLYEAAELDGAGPVRRFVHVTLPMLTPHIFFLLVMGTIGTMQIFTQAYVMTKGGPADSTMFYAYHIFNSAFRYFEMGYASAMSWLLLLIVLAMTAAQLWASKRWVHYDTV